MKFAIIIAIGVFDAGLQVNTIALGFENAFGADRLITGIILVAILGFIIIGRTKRIAHVAHKKVQIQFVLISLTFPSQNYILFFV